MRTNERLDLKRFSPSPSATSKKRHTGKKTWVAPVLTNYGSFEKITGGIRRCQCCGDVSSII